MQDHDALTAQTDEPIVAHKCTTAGSFALGFHQIKRRPHFERCVNIYYYYEYECAKRCSV